MKIFFPLLLFLTYVCGEEHLVEKAIASMMPSPPRRAQTAGLPRLGKRQIPLHPHAVAGQGGVSTGTKLSALGLGLGLLGLGIGSAEKLKGKVGKPDVGGFGGGIKAVGVGLGALGLGIKAVEHVKAEKKRRNYRGRGLIRRQFGQHSGPRRHSAQTHHGLTIGRPVLQRRPGAFRRTSVLDYQVYGGLDDYDVYDDYGDYTMPRTRADNLFL